MNNIQNDKLLLSDLYHWELDISGNILIKPNVHTAHAWGDEDDIWRPKRKIDDSKRGRKLLFGRLKIRKST